MTFSANQQHVVNVGWLQIFTICYGTSDTSINNQADVSPLSIDQEEEFGNKGQKRICKAQRYLIIVVIVRLWRNIFPMKMANMRYKLKTL